MRTFPPSTLPADIIKKKNLFYPRGRDDKQRRRRSKNYSQTGKNKFCVPSLRELMSRQWEGKREGNDGEERGRRHALIVVDDHRKSCKRRVRWLSTENLIMTLALRITFQRQKGTLRDEMSREAEEEAKRWQIFLISHSRSPNPSEKENIRKQFSFQQRKRLH